MLDAPEAPMEYSAEYDEDDIRVPWGRGHTPRTPSGPPGEETRTKKARDSADCQPPDEASQLYVVSYTEFSVDGAPRGQDVNSGAAPKAPAGPRKRPDLAIA